MISYLTITLFRLMLNQTMPWNMSPIGKNVVLLGMLAETAAEICFSFVAYINRTSNR